MSRTKNPQAAEASPLYPGSVEYKLPPLHPEQERVLIDPSRFKVVCCGRQWGKTVLGAIAATREALERGGTVWWVAPSFPIAELGWRILCKLAQQVEGVKFEQRPVFRITFPGGGSIQLRSADNPDSLRGATLDGLVFDEAAQAKRDAWPTLRPTLSVRGGWAMFISTPKGLNWFHDLFEDAGQLGGWTRWRMPSATSPFMVDEEVEAARQQMSSLMFAQEYDADFISTATGLFRADWFQHYVMRFVDEERFYQLGGQNVPLTSCVIFHTVDLAWSQAEDADYTVISTWGKTKQAGLLLLDVIRGRYEGPDIVPQLRRAYDRWGGYLVVERATRQMGIIQEAERTGLPIREVRADKDKVSRALPATARVEQGRVWFPPTSTPWWHDIEEELLAFPAGRHDDFVDTLSYAVAEGARTSVYETRGIRKLNM
jgi:predicted phage terminase large subunit-like protein